MENAIDDFIESLRYPPASGHVFNPWWEVDDENDIGEEAPEIRRHQLSRYLQERLGKAKYLLIGEAAGYQGAHFSGIAMTSERILLGYHKKRGIEPEDVFKDPTPRRTSKPEISPRGFSEPTATIVWSHLLSEGLDPREFVIWNAFPWHPYTPARGILSNRRPSGEELESADLIMKSFLSLFSGGILIAVGKVAEAYLHKLGFGCFEVRHPANGGAGRFRREISGIFSKEMVK